MELRKKLESWNESHPVGSWLAEDEGMRDGVEIPTNPPAVWDNVHVEGIYQSLEPATIAGSEIRVLLRHIGDEIDSMRRKGYFETAERIERFKKVSELTPLKGYPKEPYLITRRINVKTVREIERAQWATRIDGNA